MNIPRRRTVTLTRITSHPKAGTFGVLTLDGQEFCVTLEPYHNDNARNVSCINAGCYECQRVVSRRWGDTFEVKHVKGRGGILIHWGNVSKDTRGCIMLGNYFGMLKEQRAILESKPTFLQFRKEMVGVNTFLLIIRNAF